MNTRAFFFRGINSYVVQYYIPLISFAIATLAGFYIPPHEGNDRTGLIITLFLINVQMSLYISDEGPNADGSTGKYFLHSVEITEIYFHTFLTKQIRENNIWRSY